MPPGRPVLAVMLGLVALTALATGVAWWPFQALPQWAASVRPNVEGPGDDSWDAMGGATVAPGVQAKLAALRRAMREELRYDDLALAQVFVHGGWRQPNTLLQASFWPDWSANEAVFDAASGKVAVRPETIADVGTLCATAADCRPVSPFIFRSVPFRTVRDVGTKLTDDGLYEALSENNDTVFLPDPTDQDTVVLLGLMSQMAYENRNVTDDWVPVPGFNVVRLATVRYEEKAVFEAASKNTKDIGWDDDNLRGYVFANANESLVVLAIKGTTLDFFGGSDTGAKDRQIDNIMFSCCCAYTTGFIGPDPVCDCHQGECPRPNNSGAAWADTMVPQNNLVCCESCMEDWVRDSSTLSYYRFAQDVYKQVRATYPNASIWFTGHSLGGSLSSLMAQTYGHPAFAYNAVEGYGVMDATMVGDMIGPALLGTPNRDGDGFLLVIAVTDIYHFGNPGDVIFTGNCRICPLFNYALETRCHVGQMCIYNFTGTPNVNLHRMSTVMERFLMAEVPPPCEPESNCTECGEWESE